MSREFHFLSRQTGEHHVSDAAPADSDTPTPPDQPRPALYIFGCLGIAMAAGALHLVRVAGDDRGTCSVVQVRAHIAARFAEIVEVHP